MRDPARHTTQCENNCEKLCWNTDRFQCDARVKIDIRVELLLDKVLVAERHVFQLPRQVDDLLVCPPYLQNRIGKIASTENTREESYTSRTVDMTLMHGASVCIPLG